MKRLLIPLLLALVAFTVLGCKIKQDKTLDEMDRASEKMADKLDELNDKVDKNAIEVTDQTEEAGESAESWLDRYEAIVVTYEKKAEKGALNTTDMLNINVKLGELSQKAESARTWTTMQANRLSKLSARLTAVVGKYRP